MKSGFDFPVFAEAVPADVALRIAGRLAEAMGHSARADTLDSNIIKAMLLQLGDLGCTPDDIAQCPALLAALRAYTTRG